RDLQGEGRLQFPFLRGGADFARATWEGALGQVTGRLTDLARANGAGGIGIIASAQASNEELFLLRRLASRLEAKLTGVAWSPPDADHDDFLIKADKNPNTRGLPPHDIPPGPGDLLTAPSPGELG